MFLDLLSPILSVQAVAAAEYVREEVITMSQLFTIDLSNVSTHEKHYEIFEKFKVSWEVYEKWITTVSDQRIFYSFDAFWPYSSSPEFPSLPPEVKIILATISGKSAS